MHKKVLKALGGQNVLGFVSGFGLIKSLAPTLVITENGVFIYDPIFTGGYRKTNIPFAQITGVSYIRRSMGFPHIYVDTQAGSIDLRLPGNNTHAATLKIFYLLRDKLSELRGVPISESYEKGVGIETWSFLAPEKVSTVQAQPKSSGNNSIPDQIKKFPELRDAGILTSDEFETKKKQLLAIL